MLRPRIIPCLLLKDGDLVKSQQFANFKYIGDPLNAVRIFNEKMVDELLVLDIDASKTGTNPDYELIRKISSECRMPLCYGGGVRSVESALKIVSFGVEKISVNTEIFSNKSIIKNLAANLGSQSVVASLDVKLNTKFNSHKYSVYSNSGTNLVSQDLILVLKDLQKQGAGEILINSIDRDGMMSGYDMQLVKDVIDFVDIPVTFIGGAGSVDHVKELAQIKQSIGVAAGSLFVFKGKFRAVLINYPNPEEKKILIS